MKKAQAIFLRALADTVWCIDPAYLAALVARVETMSDNDETLIKAAEELISAKAVHGATVRAVAARQGAAAIINISGVISPTPATYFEQIFGVSRAVPSQIAAMVEEAVADEEVKVVIAVVDSPGGQAIGLPEAHASIMAARGRKPLVAVVTGNAASGGYWLASAFDEIVAGQASMVGSLGVFQAFTDYSALNEQSGIKEEYISSVPDKVESMGHIPLSDAARAHKLANVNAVDAMFMADLARGRGRDMNADGRGRAYLGPDVLSRGLADSMATLSQVLAKYNAPPRAEARGDMRARSRTLALMGSDMDDLDRTKKK